jgi:hypothetical protein
MTITCDAIIVAMNVSLEAKTTSGCQMQYKQDAGE